MAALYGIGQAIIFLPCDFYQLSFFFFFSSPILTQRLETGCLPQAYFYTWCGFSVNLECRSEMCCKQLAGNTGRINYAKSRHLRTIAQL